MPNGVIAPIIPTVLQTWRHGNLASVAPSAVNSFKIETGDNIHGIFLKFNSAVPAPLDRGELILEVAGVRMWLNGEPLFDRTTEQILDMYLYEWSKFEPLAAPLGVLPISCMNYRMPIWDQRRGFALGMLKSTGTIGRGPYNVVTMEVTMTALAAVAATCEIHVVTDQYPQEPTGLHIRRLRTTRDLLAIGDNPITDLPRTHYGLASVHIVAPDMDRLSVLYNNSYLYREIDVDTLAILMDMAGLTPQAGYAHIPFDLGEDLSSNLPFGGLNKFELHPNFTAAPGAGTVVLTEEIWDGVRE